MSSHGYEMEPGWRKALSSELEKNYFGELLEFLDKEKKVAPVYPPENKIFAALNATPFDRVKAVIIGQDPYHGPGQAQGLSFSVPRGIPMPPSLKNIFKELHEDTGILIPDHGDLSRWAQEGVLMLNAFLTVRHRQPGSHRHAGWENFTNAIIQQLCDHKEGLVFLLWGNFARSKKDLIDCNKHHVLEAPHPSPFSARKGFFGCRHFSEANRLLQQNAKNPIDWTI